MKKKVVIITILSILLFLSFPYAYVEVMTAVHYKDTINLYEKTGWILSDNYHKVFAFSENNAKVLYSEPYSVSICEFSKDEKGEWQYESLEPVIFRNKLESTPFGISIPEKNIYPLYMTKHLIKPEESKKNFVLYENNLEKLADNKKLSFGVEVDENNIDRTITLSDENVVLTIRLFNDYDGFRGYEQAEICYTCKNGCKFDLDLLMQIQEQLLHKIADEKTVGEVLAPDSVFNEAKLVRDFYPDALEIKSTDILGNGEYLLSYVSTETDEIILISGTTKRN